MGKYTWAGCIIVVAAVSPILAAEDSVKVTIRGRLKGWLYFRDRESFPRETSATLMRLHYPPR